jgi:prephenate dehydrogenase
MKLRVLTIVGVGLIGGSIGLAARRRGIADCVRGLGRSRESLDEAKALGAIDEVHLDPKTAIPGSDLVILCTPVDRIAAQVAEFAPLCGPEAVFTDAGSTKEEIVAAVEREAGGIHFVGIHPLAGSEKRGSRFADADLFAGRTTVVTPTDGTDPGAVDLVTRFWQALGSTVVRMSPAEHDAAVALTSHLPHLAASALAGIVPADLAPLTATGFRDTTRVAAGDPKLWSAIFAQNRMALLAALDAYQVRLADFREAIRSGDAERVDRLLVEGKTLRDALDRSPTRGS